MNKNIRVLFLVPYPLKRAPSQRFRVELFLPLLKGHNIEYKVQSFLDDKTWLVIYKKKFLLHKITGVIRGFLRRIKMVMFEVVQYDFVFIHREAAPIGPPVIEWLIAKIWKKKILFDYDDAIWIPNSDNRVINLIKAYGKIRLVCRWSYKVIGGNKYLCDFAENYNNNVLLIPTCVDTIRGHNSIKDQYTQEIVIGWTGSHSTLNYLNNIVPVLKRVVEATRVKVVIICNEPPSFTIPGLTFLLWKEDTEIEDLLKMNIGIMPLTHDSWSEGKCGFKLIQYLALGIPAIASPVGVNKTIVENNVNGFLCSTDNDWYKALTGLIEDKNLRAEMGRNGREKIINHYSVRANEGLFLSLFK